MQGLRCHFISMSGKSPTKLEVTSPPNKSCILGLNASIKQTKKTIYFRAHYSSVTKATGVDVIKPVYVTPVLDGSNGDKICLIHWLSKFMDDNDVRGKRSERFVLIMLACPF